MLRDDWPFWEKAIHEKYNQMYEDDAFQSVKQIEKGANKVGSMFTLNIKRDKTTGRKIQSSSSRFRQPTDTRFI